MKLKVQICYAESSQNHNIEVEVKGSLMGLKLMNAVEKAVEKHMDKLAKENANYKDWKRWNLLSIVE